MRVTAARTREIGVVTRVGRKGGLEVLLAQDKSGGLQLPSSACTNTALSALGSLRWEDGCPVGPDTDRVRRLHLSLDSGDCLQWVHESKLLRWVPVAAASITKKRRGEVARLPEHDLAVVDRVHQILYLNRRDVHATSLRVAYAYASRIFLGIAPALASATVIAMLYVVFHRAPVPNPLAVLGPF